MFRGFLKANWKHIVLALTALITGAGIGILIGLSYQEKAEIVDATGVRSVLPTTRICKETYFTKCTHRLDELVDPKGFIGYTQEELEQFYGKDSVSRFTPEEVVVTQRVDGCCPAHYLLKHSVTGELCVYTTDAKTYAASLIKVLPGYSEEELDDAVSEPLKTGIVFNTLGEIDTYLENMES